MIELKDSGVVLDKAEHTYTLDGKTLSGITKLIENKLFPDKYAGVPEATMKAAAVRGTYIHELTELYDDIGAKNEDVPELQGYIKLQSEGGYKPVRSEYIVTDGEHYASGIDAVWTKDGESVYLVDKKTTSKYYGDSVEWQLSIYAYMFELMNPGVKVAGLMGCWLRGGKAKLYPAKRHSVDEVKRLLQSGVDGTEFKPDAVERTEDEKAIEFMLLDLYDIERAMRKVKEDREQLLARLQEKMEAVGKDNTSNDYVSVTMKADSVRTSFDSSRFKKEHAALYAEYTKGTPVKGGLMVKLKKAAEE